MKKKMINWVTLSLSTDTIQMHLNLELPKHFENEGKKERRRNLPTHRIVSIIAVYFFSLTVTSIVQWILKVLHRWSNAEILMFEKKKVNGISIVLINIEISVMRCLMTMNWRYGKLEIMFIININWYFSTYSFDDEEEEDSRSKSDQLPIKKEKNVLLMIIRRKDLYLIGRLTRYIQSYIRLFQDQPWNLIEITKKDSYHLQKHTHVYIELVSYIDFNKECVVNAMKYCPKGYFMFILFYICVE